MSRSERNALIAIAAVSAILRAICFFRYRFDSDEPQHLHVAWGWSAGLVQYRDVFDNHSPLFHMLTAPLLSLAGERADILLYMRAAMLPLFAVVLIGTFVIAQRLYSTRVAWWAVVLLSIFPPFLLKSLEYRNDNLWTALWMLALALSIDTTRTRIFISSFLLGTALCVSMKTSLLVASLLTAAIARRYATRDSDGLFGNAVVATAGFLITPSLVLAYFSHLGAVGDLYRCVIAFNGQIANARPGVWLVRLIFPIAATAIVVGVRRYRGDPNRLFLATAGAVFTSVTLAFWVLISPRDFLAVIPIGAVFLAATVERSLKYAVAVAILSVLAVTYYADGFIDRTAEHITMMNQVLRLTHPGEPLMDIKGETVYRRRPFYYIFELITRSVMAAGALRDTIPEDVIAARCFVAQADGPLWPPRARKFLNENFMDMGRLRAAGQWIHDDGTFTIAVPGQYVIVNEAGHAHGTLDGDSYRGVRQLGAGRHSFIRAANERVAVLWAPAFARGFSPFHLQDRDFPSVHYKSRL